MKKKLLAILLTVCMVLSMAPAALAAEFGDTDGHWAEGSIERWADYGIIEGVGDGEFNPDGTMTRAQAAAIFARLLKLDAKADISKYTDVDSDAWYAEYIAMCVAAGIMNGVGDNAMDPNGTLTREQMMVMLCRALGIQPEATCDKTFADSDKISDWAEGYINALVNAGIVDGVGNNTMAPATDINRASMMALLDKSIAGYADENGETLTVEEGKTGVILVVADNVKVEGAPAGTIVVTGADAHETTVNGTEITNDTVHEVPEEEPVTPSVPPVIIPSHSHTWGSWVSNEDGTHTRSYTCGHSGSETKDCDGTDGVACSKCGYITGAQAKIGTTYFATLGKAFEAGGEVTLLKDITLTESLEIPEGKTVNLDLNGYKVIGDWNGDSTTNHIYAIYNYGTLTVNDSSEPSTGAVVSRGIYNYGTMTLNSGTIDACDANGGYAINGQSGSSFTMNGGSVVTSYEDGDAPGAGYDATPIGIPAGATATIAGGTITNVSNYTFAIENKGTVTIEAGQISSVHTTVANYGTMTIEGGEFTCNGLEGITAHAVWAAAGTATINGGTFNGKDNYNGFNVDSSAGANVIITGGNFLPVHSGSLYGDGTITVSGGTFFDDPSARVADTHKAVKDGEVWTVVERLPGEVINATEAQAALDNCAPNTTIQLSEGVDYGILYLRPINGSPATKTVDWQGNNYGYESYSCFENLTILGAEGATVDAIVIEGGTYFHTAHSQSETYPVMLSLIELKNVVIDGVAFTGEGGYDPQEYGNVINLSGNNIKVDGLTLKDCVLNNEGKNARLVYKTESTTSVHTYVYDEQTYTFVPNLKDITVTGCTFNGGYMGLELRETENVTITGNTFNNLSSRNILLPTNSGCTYSGTVTIIGNTSDSAVERFVRADQIGNAKLIITDNVIKNYKSTDADYIKVTGAAGETTIENNTITYGSTAAAQAALDAVTPGTTIQLVENVNYGTLVFRRNASSLVVDITEIGGDAAGNEYYSCYKNITILGAEGATVDQITFGIGREEENAIWNYIEVKDLTIQDVTFSGNKTAVQIPDGFDIAIDGLSLINCKMTSAGGENTRLVYQPHTGYETINDKTTNEYVMTSGVKNLTITGCEVVGARQIIEARPMQGITITNNTFKNSVMHDVLLAGSGADYTEITITGNTSDGAGDRFVRATSIGSGTVTITGNTITDNEKNDPIKVDGITDGNTNVNVQTTW